MQSMPPHLSAAELERLAMLAEEAGEVVQIVGKILRHGYESYNPDGDRETTNRTMLERELVDLMRRIRLMVVCEDVSLRVVSDGWHTPLQNSRWWRYQPKMNSI